MLLGAGQAADGSFQLFNSGSAPLTVTRSRSPARTPISSPSRAPPRAPAHLAPGASCQFSAAFKPSSAGARAASVEVFSNAASSPDVASLSGNAVGGDRCGRRPGRRRGRGVSNAFTIGRPILNRRKGTARLPVTLSGAGTLIATGSGVFTKPVAGPATVTVPVRARGRKRRALNRRGAVTLRLTVTFVPRGGQASTQTVRLRLRKAR